MKKDNSVDIDKLYDYCEEFTFTVITCTKCNRDAEVRVDALYALEKFYNAGWRIIDNVCLCPTCVKTNIK